jgi:hypothetical protein
MTMWTRSRSTWLMPGTLALLLIVSFLTLLPMQTRAQASLIEAFKTLDAEYTAPTPIVVVDFGNSSGYSTGMLGREFADSLSLELLNTRRFDVAKRSQVDGVLQMSSLTPPLTVNAVTVLATQLQCQYGVTGDIKSVTIKKTREGTYAEVSVQALLVSRILGDSISGAEVVQKCAPRIGYNGSTDVLVHEALTLASYDVAQKILNTRFLVAMVIGSARAGEVILRGGATLGLRQGMELITLRRETVTGRIRVTKVGPTESVAELTGDNRGIAPGDKAIPVFTLVDETPVISANRAAAGERLAALGLFVALAKLIGGQGGTPQAMNPHAPSAGPLADAVPGNELGANRVGLPSSSDAVIAYMIFRDTNPNAPVALVTRGRTYYLDSATPLETDKVMESTVYAFDLDPTSGIVTPSPPIVTTETDTLEQANSALSITKTSFTITTRRVPLQPGETCSYYIEQLFYGVDEYNLDDPTPTSPHPQAYRLFLSNQSALSARTTLTEPPALQSPANGEVPLSGIYRCESVPSATRYQLQLSLNQQFSTLLAVADGVSQGAYVQAVIDMASLNTSPTDYGVYWRIGVRVDGSAGPVALADGSSRDYIYSQVYFYALPPNPYPPPGKGGRWDSLLGVGVVNKTLPDSGFGVRQLLRHSN